MLSGGTEGVLSPHYMVFCRGEDGVTRSDGTSLAIGTAFSAPVAAERRRRDGACRQRRQRGAGGDRESAGIEQLDDVHFVQVKCPCVTVARAAAAIAAGKSPLTDDPNKSMAFARAAGAFGVAAGAWRARAMRPSPTPRCCSDFSI